MSNLENDLVDQPEEETLKQQSEAPADSLRILEALLFASDEIMTSARLKALLPGTPDARAIGSMVEKINRQLQKERHPFEIVEIGGGYQFKTVAYYHPWVRQIFKEKASKRLSIQALECLSIIAYRQPLSKAEIEGIRGVLSDGAMKTLLEKHLVTIAGRSDKPGRPLLYGTTPEFLKYFGLNKIGDLPRIEEFEAMVREKMESLGLDELKSVQDQIVQDAAAETEATIEISMPPDAQKDAPSTPLEEEAGLFEAAAQAPAPEAVETTFDSAAPHQVMEAETVRQPAVREELHTEAEPVVTVKKKRKSKAAKTEIAPIASEVGEETTRLVLAREAVFETTVAPDRKPTSPGAKTEDTADAVFEPAADKEEETVPEPVRPQRKKATEQHDDDAVFEAAAAPDKSPAIPATPVEDQGDAVFEAAVDKKQDSPPAPKRPAKKDDDDAVFEVKM